MNGYETIAHILQIEGVEWISCFPNNALLEAASKVGIRPVMFRHERGAVMAADGYSRTSGRTRFGVIAVQAGPGVENSMGGISQAFADNIPVLLLPGATRLDQLSIRPNFYALHNYRAVTKHVEIVTKPDQVSSVMRRAFHALKSGPAGPVIVEMPSDVCSQEVPDGSREYKPPKACKALPAEGEIKDAVRALLKARKPVIWSGGGALHSGAAEELTELSELMQIPVYCTLQGKSSFDERHPLSLGAGSGATTLPARRWLDECDVLFAVGSSLTETPFAQKIPDGKLVIQNTDRIEDINKDIAVDIGLLGDARLTLRAVIDEIKAQLGEAGRKKEPSGVAAEIAALKEQWLAEWKPLLESDEVPINTYRVIGDIDRTLDRENSIVTHDAGSPRDTLVPFYTATTPFSYVGWGKTTHLGFGLPLIIGAKLAHPDKFCLNFMGDGAFGMSGIDIETSVRAEVPITTVVLDNGGMATYPGGFPFAREHYGLSRMGGNYAQIAEAMGAVGITVKEPQEIVPALEKAMSLNREGKTVLIDVHTNFESRRSRF